MYMNPPSKATNAAIQVTADNWGWYGWLMDPEITYRTELYVHYFVKGSTDPYIFNFIVLPAGIPGHATMDCNGAHLDSFDTCQFWTF